MAENRGGEGKDKGDEESGETQQRAKAIRLLREVTDLLSGKKDERSFASGPTGDWPAPGPARRIKYFRQFPEHFCPVQSI